MTPVTIRETCLCHATKRAPLLWHLSIYKKKRALLLWNIKRGPLLWNLKRASLLPIGKELRFGPYEQSSLFKGNEFSFLRYLLAVSRTVRRALLLKSEGLFWQSVGLFCWNAGLLLIECSKRNTFYKRLFTWQIIHHTRLYWDYLLYFIKFFSDVESISLLFSRKMFFEETNWNASTGTCIESGWLKNCNS